VAPGPMSHAASCLTKPAMVWLAGTLRAETPANWLLPCSCPRNTVSAAGRTRTGSDSRVVNLRPGAWRVVTPGPSLLCNPAQSPSKPANGPTRCRSRVAQISALSSARRKAGCVSARKTMSVTIIPSRSSRLAWNRFRLPTRGRGTRISFEFEGYGTMKTAKLRPQQECPCDMSVWLLHRPHRFRAVPSPSLPLPDGAAPLFCAYRSLRTQ